MKEERKGRGEGKKGGRKRKLLEVMDTFTALTAVTVSKVYAYLQTHQVAYIKYIQLLYVRRKVLYTKKEE